jgi:hypothetical protein
MKVVKQNLKNIDTRFKYNVIVTSAYEKNVETYTFVAEDFEDAYKIFGEQLLERASLVKVLSQIKYTIGIYRIMNSTIEVVNQVQMQSNQIKLGFAKIN